MARFGRLSVIVAVIWLVAGACASNDGGVASTTIVATTAAPETTTTAGPTTTPQVAPSTGAPDGKQRGGEVVIADDQEPPTLNPFIPGGDNFIVSIVGQAHMAGAYDVAASSLELVPELVVEIPSAANGGVAVNDDGSMSVRYRIRDEATWSDGMPVTGDDFALTLDLEQGLCMQDFDGAIEFDIEDVGPKTIVVRADTPTLHYETLFEWVAPAHALADTDLCGDWIDVTWPAAGPFVVDEIVRGDRITLVRNENYWKTDLETGLQLPYLDSVVFRFIPETESILSAFRARDVDVIQPPPFQEVIDDLEALGSEGAVVEVVAGPVWEHFNFQFGPGNRNEGSLNQHRTYRQALAYAIDRDAMLEAIAVVPSTHAADSFVSFSVGAETHAWAHYEPDPVRARQLVAEACEQAERDCSAEPPRVVFSTTSNGDVRIRVAEALEVQLEAVGIQVDLELEDSQLFFGETLDSGTWDMGLWAWVAAPGAAGAVAMFDLFDPDAPPPQGDNYYRWGTSDSPTSRDEAVARYRQMYAELGVTHDRDRALELAVEMEQLLADEAIIIPLYNRRVVGAYWADEIAGYAVNPTQASHTWNIETWYRVDW